MWADDLAATFRSFDILLGAIRAAGMHHSERLLQEDLRERLETPNGESRKLGVRKTKGPSERFEEAFEFNPGGDLRSHTVTRAVSSARRGLTTVFGMGTGVTLAV